MDGAQRMAASEALPNVSETTWAVELLQVSTHEEMCGSSRPLQGALHMTRHGLSLAERFWRRVPERSPWPDVCWQWRGGSAGDGYGIFRVGPHRTERAHRVAWRTTGSEIPDGMELDHACRRRDCVRPEHLTLVEKYFNARQGSATFATRKAAQTQCRNGHPYVDGSFAITITGYRQCRRCSCVNSARHRLKTKARI